MALDYDYILNHAIDLIKRDHLVKELIKRHPIKEASPTVNGDIYPLLKQSGSPALTDGESVFVSKETLKQLLEQPYYEYGDLPACAPVNDDLGWVHMPDTQRPKVGLTITEAIRETECILLHELTHAVQNHVGTSKWATSKSKSYQARLAVAQEIQANDSCLGIIQMSTCYIEQLRGVTNKRLHPETLGAHSIKDIMDKLQMNGNESALSRAQIRQKMSEATGADKRIKASGGEDMGEAPNRETIARTVFRGEFDNLEKLIVEALSSELKYDPFTHEVIKAPCVKKLREKTYSRINKHTLDGSIIRKGVKKRKEKVPDKINKLVILAVDTSGSMEEVGKYVASITEQLLDRVEATAKKYNVELKRDNLLGTIFNDFATDLVPVTSEEWKRRVSNLTIGGGTYYSQVIWQLERVTGDYDEITVIEVGDGEGCVGNALGEITLAKYKEWGEQGKFKWVDALISPNFYDNAVGIIQRDDLGKYRTPIMVVK